MTAADVLNDCVLPGFEQQRISLFSVLTDRGNEYCGNREHHKYEWCLDVENMEPTRTKTTSPQTHGIGERFHQTIHHEFYANTLRRKLYRSLEELQADVDEWLRSYNGQRAHSGKYCFDKTPMQTLIDSRQLALRQLD